MAHRKPFDHQLTLRPIKVQFVTGSSTTATAEGNNAAWTCECGELLVGRCYFQFGDVCHTKCGSCGRTYRVEGDQKKKATRVLEEGAA
jgi:hypothetical protein